MNEIGLGDNCEKWNSVFDHPNFIDIYFSVTLPKHRQNKSQTQKMRKLHQNLVNHICLGMRMNSWFY